MEAIASRQTNLAPSPQVSAQTSADSNDPQKKVFDPEQLKDEKAALGAAREMAAAHTESAAASAAAGAKVELPSTMQRDSAEWSRSEGAPNWSTLSAQSKGYTFTERAINLYRHINAMAI